MRHTLVIATIVLLALAAGVVWVIRTGALAESARVRAVDEATRALGREVRIDALAGDPWRGIELRGVRIAGPTGSARPLFEARQIVFSVDAGQLLRDLIDGRGVLPSLRRVELDRPFFALARDGSGRWSYADLLPGPPGAAPAPPSFRAVVDVREGRVEFTDALRLPQRVGGHSRPFAVSFVRINGTADFAKPPAAAIEFDAVNPDGPTPALVRLAGRVTLGEGAVDLDLHARGGAVSVWGPYLVRLPWITWDGGTFDSTMHVLTSRWGRGVVLDYRGQLHLRDGRAMLLPRRTRLSNVNGPLAVDNVGVTTTGMTLTVDGSPLSARGRITVPGGAAMDLVLRSRALNLRTLQTLLFPRAQVRLTGRARGEVRIVGPFASPAVEGAIDRASGSVNRQGFAELSGRFHYYGGVLSFDQLAASAGAGQIRGQLRLDVGTGSVSVLADVRNLDPRILDGVGVAVPPTFSGAATGFIAATQAPDGVLAHVRLGLGRGAAFGVRFDGASTVFGYDRGLLEVDHFQAHSGTMRLHGFGAMSRGGELEFAVTGTDLDLHALGERFGLQRWIAGTADVSGRLGGTLRSPELDGEIRGRAGRLGPLPFDLARGRFHLTSTTLQSPDLQLLDAAGRYVVSGLIRWAAPSRVDLTARAVNVSVQRLLGVAAVPLRADGTIAAAVRLSGPADRPLAEGVVELRDGQVEGQRVDRATTAFRWTGREFLVQSFRAAVRNSTLLASGTIGRRGALGITFSAQALDLKDVSALKHDAFRLEGTADLTGNIRGTLGAPVVNATATSGNLVVNGQQFDRASGEVSFRGGRLALTPLELRQPSGSMKLSGTILLRDNPVVDLHITAEKAELATLLGLARLRPPIALRGAIDGEVTTSGPLSNPRASLDIRLADGRLGEGPIQEAVVRADLADRAVTLQTLRILPAQGELVGAGRINLRGRSEVEFGGTGVDLNVLQPLLNLPGPLRGAVDFTLQLTGALNDPLVGLSVAAAEGGIGPTSFDRLSFQAFYRAGQFNIEQGVIQDDRHRVRIAGSLPFDPTRMRLDEQRPVNLRLELVDSDLGVLRLFTDRIERAEGRLAGVVSVVGTAARPHLEGQVTASGGTLKVQGLEPPLTDLQAQITFAQDTLRIDAFSARAEGGIVTLTGTVGFRRFRPDQFNLTLASDGARLTVPGLFSGRVEGGLRLTGTMARPEISGTATVSNGDIIVPAARRLAPQPANGPSGPRLDVEVRAGDALWVNVGGLRFQVGGAVRTSGTLSAPRLSGEVVAERGAFVAFNTTFRLLEGRATFSEFRGLTPVVDAVAETRVSVPTRRASPGQPAEYVRTVVRLQVTGTPDALDLQITSEPSFPRSELVAALGRQSGFAAIFTGGAALESALLNEVSSALFGQVGRVVASALGLEEFALEYDTERQLSLRIGTLLIENLYITWTSEFGTPRRNVWALEYRLSPTTRFSFSVDNFARYNFLYRVTYDF